MEKDYKDQSNFAQITENTLQLTVSGSEAPRPCLFVTSTGDLTALSFVRKSVNGASDLPTRDVVR